MDPGLSGVVACIQEIEIACAHLVKMTELKGADRVGDLQKMIRGFFLEPSARRAEQLDETLAALAAEYQGKESIITKTVEVDRLQTTLAALHQELREVLEDLDG